MNTNPKVASVLTDFTFLKVRGFQPCGRQDIISAGIFHMLQGSLGE